MKYRKSLLALTCALPLVLTACGKDGGEAEDGAKNTAAESANSAATSEPKPNSDKPSESSTAKESDKADKDKQGSTKPAPGQKESKDGASSNDTNRDANAANGRGGENKAADRGEGRAPRGASAGDSQQITSLVQGMGKHRSAYDFLNYSVNNSCKSYINSQGGEKVIRSNNETIKAMGPEGNKAIPVPRIKSVDDIQVNGDNATARVTASYGNKAPQTESMSFARENGKWTLCPS